MQKIVNTHAFEKLGKKEYEGIVSAAYVDRTVTQVFKDEKQLDEDSKKVEDGNIFDFFVCIFLSHKTLQSEKFSIYYISFLYQIKEKSYIPYT